MSEVTKPRIFDAQRGLTDATVGVVLAVALVLFASLAAAEFWITDPNVSLLLSYLAVWIPLLGAVGIAWLFHGHDLGLRFHWLDLLWGLSIGLLARSVASVVEILGYGQMGSSAVTFGETVYDGWWLFGALLAPVLLAPLVEELFFRGLLLRSVLGVTRLSGGARGTSTVIAVLVSALVFALVHVLTVGTVTGVWVAGVSTFVFGLGAACLAVLTGRLGGAIIAHVTFNALVVVPALLVL
ncbi:CPBP family intramembrane glutamic endopeptidase [Cryobacterium sp. MLB-32]|uniref:CPBP family intramembrane glutamic endopeptidase n=1 Tax=Cryobacterium sp. MLB-32 TaxID=1529318 RepID=UPI000564F139|nr:CPBP family intramembrane glutamic endopeptidase [Cryobacterium sp. MLB-32]